MYLSLEQFIEDWKNEAQSTLRLFNALTQESLQQEVSPHDRNLGRMAWHIVTTIHEMMSRTGLMFEAPDEESKLPETVQEIVNGYRSASESLIRAVQEQWTDESLKEERNLYGEPWSNGLTLSILIRHQIHHRGQMTVLMRQAGLRVPGVCGPSREEWSNMGMQAPLV